MWAPLLTGYAPVTNFGSCPSVSIIIPATRVSEVTLIVADQLLSFPELFAHFLHSSHRHMLLPLVESFPSTHPILWLLSHKGS
jgi:hypothetical protein